MSHSFRKTPKCAITVSGFNNSEKEDKRKANRALRHRVKALLNLGDEEMPQLREVSNNYTFLKDGKQYFGNIKFEGIEGCWRK